MLGRDFVLERTEELFSGIAQRHGCNAPCRVGFKIGPLVADDRGCAEKVLATLVAARPT